MMAVALSVTSDCPQCGKNGSLSVEWRDENLDGNANEGYLFGGVRTIKWPWVTCGNCGREMKARLA